ncbi:MAG: hypothetical protein IH865_09110 [Chloroflexi bacterium]|nr:hypothetical protein [Chloroflexota bacterium]
MKTKWLLIGVALITAVLALGAIACGDDDDDDDGNGDIIDDVIDDVIDDDMILQLVASLTGPEASGEAEISPNGEGILVTLIMEGLTEGAHANHLHHGTCDDQGEIHIFLDDIVADDSGDGSQTTSNDEQPISHFESGHYLAVHVEDSETIGEVISCGDVVDPLA